jgi:hypothetical protein
LTKEALSSSETSVLTGATRRNIPENTIVQAKFRWLQDPSEINGENLNNVRREASRHFRNKERGYLKDTTDELAMDSKNKSIRDLYRGINEFKRV